MGAVDILIVWENLEIQRFVLKNHALDGKAVLHYMNIRVALYFN